MDELFLIEFFRQSNRKYREKNFKKKCFAFKEFIRICNTKGLKKTDKITPMMSKRFVDAIDPTLQPLAKEALNFLLSGMFPKDVVTSYKSYCQELYGKEP